MSAAAKLCMLCSSIQHQNRLLLLLLLSLSLSLCYFAVHITLNLLDPSSLLCCTPSHGMAESSISDHIERLSEILDVLYSSLCVSLAPSGR
jgi:hypothetical protein